MTLISELKNEGLIILTGNELLTEIESRFKNKLGNDIKTDGKSGYGVIIGILSELFANNNETIEAVYNARYPLTADGESLNNAGTSTLNFPIQQAYSTTTVTLTNNTASPVIIPEGTLIKQSETNTEWEILSEQTIPANDTLEDVPVMCTLPGDFSAEVGSIDTIVNPVSGWSAVTNELACSVDNGNIGRYAETSAEFKQRLLSSAVSAQAGPVQAVVNKLYEVTGVTYATGRENRTMNVDSNGLQPKSYNFIVDGGSDEDIAETIYEASSGGLETNGSESYTVTDTAGDPLIIYFDRITSIDIYFICNLTTDANYPIDGDDQVKAALVTFGEGLERGGDVYNWKAIAALTDIPGITAMTILQGIAPAPGTSANISIGVNERANIQTANITVNS